MMWFWNVKSMILSFCLQLIFIFNTYLSLDLVSQLQLIVSQSVIFCVVTSLILALSLLSFFKMCSFGPLSFVENLVLPAWCTLGFLCSLQTHRSEILLCLFLLYIDSRETSERTEMNNETRI